MNKEQANTFIACLELQKQAIEKMKDVLENMTILEIK